MDWGKYHELCEHIHAYGFLLCITPFDEESVMIAVEMEVDILKVASCSADDWPLLEAVARTGKPVIASTGGLT
jgi:N-acetylneuraminate synthase